VVIAEAQEIANADGNVIVNDYDYGVAIGEATSQWINEKLDGKAEVLLIAIDQVEAVILRGDGMEDTITSETNAEIIARQSAQTTEEALNVAETVLQANPDVKVITCINDQLALGATEAVKNLGLTSQDFFVGGADNTAEGRAKMMEENSVFRLTIDIDPYGTGADCVDVMYDYVINGVKNDTFYFEMTPIWQEDLT
jgi:ribose transport system substrate-binding protein